MQWRLDPRCSSRFHGRLKQTTIKDNTTWLMPTLAGVVWSRTMWKRGGRWYKRPEEDSLEHRITSGTDTSTEWESLRIMVRHCTGLAVRQRRNFQPHSTISLICINTVRACHLTTLGRLS